MFIPERMQWVVRNWQRWGRDKFPREGWDCIWTVFQLWDSIKALIRGCHGIETSSSSVSSGTWSMLEVQLGPVDYQASDVGGILWVPPICDGIRSFQYSFIFLWICLGGFLVYVFADDRQLGWYFSSGPSVTSVLFFLGTCRQLTVDVWGNPEENCQVWARSAKLLSQPGKVEGFFHFLLSLQRQQVFWSCFVSFLGWACSCICTQQ